MWELLVLYQTMIFAVWNSSFFFLGLQKVKSGQRCGVNIHVLSSQTPREVSGHVHFKIMIVARTALYSWSQNIVSNLYREAEFGVLEAASLYV